MRKTEISRKFENAREKVATIQTEIQALRERNENPTLDGAFADIDTNLTGLLDDFKSSMFGFVWEETHGV